MALNKNGLLYTLIFAFIVTFVFVVPLSFANELTKDRVAENAVIAEAAAVLKAFGFPVNKEDREGTKAQFATLKVFQLERLGPLGQLQGYKLLSDQEAQVLKTANPGAYVKVFEATGTDGTPLVGKVFTATGLWGPIQVVMSFDRPLTRIQGLSILAHSETPGLGARIDEPWYQEMVTGENYVEGKITLSPTAVDRSNKTDGKIDVITGATRTSEGMRDVYAAARAEMEVILAQLPVPAAPISEEAQP